MRMPSYTIGGKPDLITVNPDGVTGTIHEAKSNAPRNLHQVQTLLYMWAVPQAFAMYRNIRFDGRVVYQDGEILLPQTDVNPDFLKRMSDLVKRLSDSIPPPAHGSVSECKWCRVPDCSARVDPDTADGNVELDDLDF